MLKGLAIATQLRAETGIYDDVSKVERRAAAASLDARELLFET